jgi:hypothetical protein
MTHAVSIYTHEHQLTLIGMIKGIPVYFAVHENGKRMELYLCVSVSPW